MPGSAPAAIPWLGHPHLEVGQLNARVWVRDGQDAGSLSTTRLTVAAEPRSTCSHCGNADDWMSNPCSSADRAPIVGDEALSLDLSLAELLELHAALTLTLLNDIG